MGPLFPGSVKGEKGCLDGAEVLEDPLEQIGREFIEQRVRELTRYLLDKLKELGVDIWTPQADHERAGIVFFRTANHESLHAKLKQAKIYCGTFLGGIRVDPTFYNTYEELDEFLTVVKSHLAAGKD